MIPGGEAALNEHVNLCLDVGTEQATKRQRRAADDEQLARELQRQDAEEERRRKEETEAEDARLARELQEAEPTGSALQRVAAPAGGCPLCGDDESELVELRGCGQ